MSKMKFTKAQTKAIFEEGQNILVSAGAGSGKTAVLTERILEKLKKGISIDQLLVLSFTNAAAFEMKERIKNKIEKEIEKGNTKLIKEAEKIENAHITTFDSFSLFLVKKYHYLLEIDRDIQIGDVGALEIERRKILEEILEEKYEEKDRDFYLLIDTFCVKDDERLKQILLMLDTKVKQTSSPKEILENYFVSYFTEEKIDSYIKEYENLLKEDYTKIQKEMENLSFLITQKTSLFYEKLNAVCNIIPKNPTYDDFRKLHTVKLPIVKGEEEIKEVYDKIKESFRSIKEKTTYENREEIKKELQSTEKTIKVILDILKRLEEKMWKYKKENKMFTFSDITLLAIHLLQENEKVKENIKEKINEIMIDEYQDTNDINEYFISLIANNNLYMVGDVKQSIYGFRNANPSLFMKKYEDYQKGKGGLLIDLTENFRSKKEVIDAVNTIFEKIMDKEIGGADYTKGHQMISSDAKKKEEKEIDHHLEVLNYQTDKEYTKEEIEAFLIGYDIKKKIKEGYTIFDKKEERQRPVTFSDFTILMDRKTSFPLYKKVFTYLNIPATVSIEEKGIESDEIYVIKNICKLLICYRDKQYYDASFMHPFLSVARSFLFAYPDEEIEKAFTKKEEEKITLYRAIQSMPIFEDFHKKIESVYQKLNTCTLSTLLYEIYDTFDFYNKMSTKENVGKLASLIDSMLSIAQSLEQIGYTIDDFISYIENVGKYKMEMQVEDTLEENKGVIITNIHKSKGLEYPICYYSGLYKTFSKEDFKDKFLFHKKYGLIVPIWQEGIKETILKTLVKQNYIQKDKSEKIRLFYVALTRAREKIILVTSIEEKEKKKIQMVPKEVRLSYNSFSDMVKSIKGNLYPYIHDVDVLVEKEYYKNKRKVAFENIPKTEKKINLVEIKVEKEETKQTKYSSLLAPIDKETKRKMEEGTQLHHYLEILDFQNIEKEFQKYQVPCFYQDIIQKFLHSKIFQDKKIKNIYKEYNFYDIAKQKKGIIDLLIETEDSFLIIDYKLKEIEKESYQNQIKGYAEYIKTITDKKLEGYLYSLLEGSYKKVNLKTRQENTSMIE